MHGVFNGYAGKNFILSPRYNSMSVFIYITLFLLIGPLLPGVSWFKLGDFTPDMVNYIHTIMIPFVFLLFIYSSELLNLLPFERKIVNIGTYPFLLISALGIAFYYPARFANIDYALQAIRDVWMIILAVIFLVSLILMPFHDREKFRKIWGAYALLLVGTVSGIIASLMGVIYEYGFLFGFASVPWFNNYVIAWGGLNTFLGNIFTSHSHQMLPAVMGVIVALAAIYIGYEKLSAMKRGIVNVSLLISVFGVISMSYLYFISAFGTYSIPTLFISGTGGMNGLALDDSQTGLIGAGALISIAGLYYALSLKKPERLLQALEMYIWMATMAVMIGVGYSMEFNETYYGFGSPGTPPAGGAGYLYDQAFTNGHLLFAFFLMPLLAGILLVFIYFVREQNTLKNIIVAFAGTGTTIGAFGVLVYTITLSWYVEATGLAMVILAILLIAISSTIAMMEKRIYSGVK